MLSKSIIKYVRSLRDQKYRQKYHKIVVEGVKTVHDILSDHLLTVEAIYATQAWIDEKSSQYGSFLPLIVEIKDQELENISSLRTPQEVLAVCAIPEHASDPKQPLVALCLYLDGIRDPGNMGTIFRIADWFGIRHVFLSEDCVDPYNPKVIQASMGSLFRIKWSEYPLKELLDIHGLNTFVARLDGEDIYTHKLSSSGLIVLGNESSGVRDIGDERRIQPIRIPNAFCLGADSLNVAVAAGIICAEFRRRTPS